ncbi:MAG TPA: hypothetical protein VG013_27980, partial [Gemmataceae bacterium]|nr:hypothetical protein [Gemmataceae bacterium]
LKSTDAGKTWTSIRGDLPLRGSVLAIAEDHKDPNLLFVGTEHGLYFTIDGGKKWNRLKGGLPTIAVRDLAIQKQMDDLVVGTFGRGIYVLDDYSPLRGLKADLLKQEAVLFPVKDAVLYLPTQQFGLRDKAFLGESFYTAANPPFGATFTYRLKEEIKTKKQMRQKAEKDAAKKEQVAPYPTPEQLRAEAEEEAPAILLTVTDAAGHTVRTLTGPVGAGIQRVAWNLRHPAPVLSRPRPGEADDDIFAEEPSGALVLPGKYRVSLSKRVEGIVTPLAGPQEFTVVVEGSGALADADRKELAEFQQKVARLDRAVSGALDAANELSNRLAQVQRAVDQTPGIDAKWHDAVRALEKRDRDILRALRGDTALRARNENTPTSVVERVRYIVDSQRFALSRPTKTQQEAYQIANEEFTQELAKLRTLIEVDVRDLEKALEAAGAPPTPGRLPEWKDK